MQNLKQQEALKTPPLTNTPQIFQGIIKLLKDKELLLDTYKEFENTDTFWNYTPEKTQKYYAQKKHIKNEIDTLKVFFYEFDLKEKKRKKQANFDLQKQLERWVTEHEINLLKEENNSLSIELKRTKALLKIANTLLEFENFSRELLKNLSEKG